MSYELFLTLRGATTLMLESQMVLWIAGCIEELERILT